MIELKEKENCHDRATPKSRSPFVRNSDGLLEGVNYLYKNNGSIDWRRMVKPEYTVINAQYKNKLEEIHQKPLEEIKIEDIEDKYLLVLLAGFKELASIRGFNSVIYNIKTAQRDYVGVGCSITWIPNFETGNEVLNFQSLADASPDNTSGFGTQYLMAVAENRSFVRCVRNSLGIHIVGADEMKSPSHIEQKAYQAFSPTEPHGVLNGILTERKKTFNKFKDEWISLGNDQAKNWNSLSDIPVEQIFIILETINRPKKK